MQNSKWTLWNGILWISKKQRKHISLFWQNMPTMEQKFKKPQKDGKRTRMDDPNVPYILFFWSLVPWLVQRCQGNSGINLKPSDNDDYPVIKSQGSTTFTVNGEENMRSCPQYVHFNNMFKGIWVPKTQYLLWQFPLNLIT